MVLQDDGSTEYLLQYHCQLGPGVDLPGAIHLRVLPAEEGVPVHQEAELHQRCYSGWLALHLDHDHTRSVKDVPQGQVHHP